MPTSAVTLTQRVRRFIRDWPDQDALTASCTSTGTLTVADATVYSPNWHIQVDQEAMRVVTAVGTTLTTRRGVMGTAAATHTNASTILTQPRFLDVEILDAINAGISACFPLIYKPVSQEYTGIASNLYEYTLPNMTGLNLPIPYLYRIEYQEVAADAFREVRPWRVIRSVAPVIKFRRPLPAGGTLRILGFGPFNPLTMADSLDTYWPTNAEDLLVWYAGNYLLASGEAGRVRIDTGATVIDERESANRVGSSMTAANSIFQRFQIRLREAAMPPLPRHIVPTI